MYERRLMCGAVYSLYQVVLGARALRNRPLQDCRFTGYLLCFPLGCCFMRGISVDEKSILDCSLWKIGFIMKLVNLNAGLKANIKYDEVCLKFTTYLTKTST